MKRIECMTMRNQIMIIPTFGIIKPKTVIKYKYRIAFAWMIWRASIGVLKYKY
jgi:hypothetical protein